MIRELKEEVTKLRGLIKAEGLEAKVAAYGESDTKKPHPYRYTNIVIYYSLN